MKTEYLKIMIFFLNNLSFIDIAQFHVVLSLELTKKIFLQMFFYSLIIK